MASLRFNYQGVGRTGRDRPPLPFFAGRYSGGWPVRADAVDAQSANATTEEQQEKGDEVQETVNEEINNDIKEEVKEEVKEEASADISELLISRLSTAETGLVSVKAKVDLAREFLDDMIYKFDSLSQIMDIVRANEERRAGGVQVASLTSKETKDSIDEFLELMQTPALQGIIRQFLLGISSSKVTLSGAKT